MEALISGTSHRVSDSQLTASSEWRYDHGPEFSRLHSRETADHAGAWCALILDIHQWIQVSQLERISPLLKDSIRQIKETLGQFLTRLPWFLLKWRFLLFGE